MRMIRRGIGRVLLRFVDSARTPASIEAEIRRLVDERIKAQAILSDLSAAKTNAALVKLDASFAALAKLDVSGREANAKWVADAKERRLRDIETGLEWLEDAPAREMTGAAVRRHEEALREVTKARIYRAAANRAEKTFSHISELAQRADSPPAKS